MIGRPRNLNRMQQPATSATSLVTLQDVRNARDVIGDRLLRTPLVRSLFLSSETGARVSLKLELFQHTGSFKAARSAQCARGALA